MTVTIGRRELLAVVGSAAAAWPLATRLPDARLPDCSFAVEAIPTPVHVSCCSAINAGVVLPRIRSGCAATSSDA
jgi:hypothetical protein